MFAVPHRSNSTTGGRRRPGVSTGESAGGAIGLLWILAILQVGCVTIVTPPDPASLDEPVPVYLINYSRHSSLMPPRTGPDEGVLREYGFGEWRWFAENRTALTRAAVVLLAPTQGALGRTDHPVPDDVSNLRVRHGFRAVHEILVERSLADALLERLDHRFHSRRETRVVNPVLGLELVKDDRRYSLANHCNHATVRWLRDLDVQACPVTAIARFRIRDPG